MNYNSALYAFGAILLGVVTLCFGDFALQWQPVPAGIGMRTPLVYLSALLLLAGGGALLVRRWERSGALLLAVFYGSWVVALHLPRAFAAAGHIYAWNGPAEITYLAMGAVVLVATSAGSMRKTLILVARILAGASAVVFGFTHFNYIDITATFVPAWSSIGPAGSTTRSAPIVARSRSSLAIRTGSTSSVPRNRLREGR